jgi:hypothetical protein
VTRREMLGEGMNSLKKTLPALLGAAGGLAVLLKTKPPTPARPSRSFPAGPTASEAKTGSPALQGEEE